MSAPRYMVAETDDAGRPLRYLRPEDQPSETSWTDDPAEALTMDAEAARDTAGDWNDYNRTKGTGRTFRAVPAGRGPLAYIIANEASDPQSLTFRAYHNGAPWWARRMADAERHATLADARTALAKIEAERARAGRRIILAEILDPDGRTTTTEVMP